MSQATALRKILAQPGALLLPGAYDAMAAKLAALAGFKAVYLSGSALAMSRFGYPDVGLLTMTEVMDQVRRVTSAVDIPVVVDADTGYGNALNVWRTVREAEASGAAAIQLEDQDFPKKCGHFEGKQVVSASEMVGKIKAALEARQTDLLIIARTDARAVNGLDDAIARAQAYAEAGAEIIFVEAPRSREEMARICQSVKAPLLINVVEGGKTPQLSMAELAELGYKVVLYPTSSIRAVAYSLQTYYTELDAKGTTADMTDRFITFEERNRLNRLSWFEEWERKFSS
ncbi:MAG TPA: oxaloacetate decarboxylase [Symbiobacteriaceae bacterium]|nr:oxaloacetate decarboxylase [Symbiobacteriaceae bacterium]